MPQTRAEKIEQIKQFGLVALVAVVSLGMLGGWFFYIKPMLRPVQAENQQHPYFMRYMDDQTKLRASFNRDMTQIGWSHILDFTRAKSDPGMKDALQVVALAKKAVAQYTAASEDIDNKTQVALTSVQPTPEARAAALETYTALVALPREMVRKTWKMEAQVVEQVEKIVVIMSREPRTWTLVDGKLKFDFPSDQVAFDACLHRVAEISQEQQVLRTSTIENTAGAEPKK